MAETDSTHISQEMQTNSTLNEKNSVTAPVETVTSAHQAMVARKEPVISLRTIDVEKASLQRRSSAFTEDLPETVELEFLREGWSNRVIADKNGNPLYFADIPWQWKGTKLKLYRGDQKTVVASLSRKSLNKRIFYNLHINEKGHDEGVEIEGSKAPLGFDYFFDYEGGRYRWREKPCKFCAPTYEVLVDVETGEVIAKFKNASLLDSWRDKRYGKLVIYNETWKNDEKLLDLIVMTLVAVKQRTREKQRMRGVLAAIIAASDAGSN
jgi:hypothetical protein